MAEGPQELYAIVGFTPRDLPGLGLWLDATDTATIRTTGGGGNVAQWSDKSGNGRHATVGPGLNPTYSNNAVYFNGVDRYLNVDLDFLAGVSHSAFIVLQNNNYVNIYGAATAGAGANSLHVGFLSDTTYRMNYWGNDWNPAITSHYRYGATNILNYIWISGDTKQIYANGGYEGNNSTGIGVVGTMAGGGRIGSVVGQGFLDGMIQEIILYTGDTGDPVSEENRQKLEGYLASKYGLTSLLPDANPYKYISFVYTPPCVYTVPVLGDLGDFPVYPDPVMWFIPEAVGPAGPFAPPSIPGLQLWLDAADSNTVSVSPGTSNVTQWRDKSGNGNNATGVFFGRYPLYSNSAMSFNNSAYFIVSSIQFSFPKHTAFAIVSYRTSATHYILGSLSLQANRGYQMRIQNNIQRVQTVGGGFVTTGATLPENTRLLYNYTLDIASNVFLYYNGSQSGTSTNSFSFLSSESLTIASASKDVSFNGQINEILLYTNTLTDNQRQQVEGYLAWKWGLQGNLPSGHPNQFMPP